MSNKNQFDDGLLVLFCNVNNFYADGIGAPNRLLSIVAKRWRRQHFTKEQKALSTPSLKTN